MKEVADSLRAYEADGPRGDGDNHILRMAAKTWATWTINNTTGERLRKGLEICRILTEYAALDDPEGGST